MSFVLYCDFCYSKFFYCLSKQDTVLKIQDVPKLLFFPVRVCRTTPAAERRMEDGGWRMDGEFIRYESVVHHTQAGMKKEQKKMSDVMIINIDITTYCSLKQRFHHKVQ